MGCFILGNLNFLINFFIFVILTCKITKMIRHLLILIKSLIVAAFFLVVINLGYFGYAYYQAGMEGTIGFSLEKFTLLLNDKSYGLPWGVPKTYGFAGFLFLIVWVRELLKAGTID